LALAFAAVLDTFADAGSAVLAFSSLVESLADTLEELALEVVEAWTVFFAVGIALLNQLNRGR
jgi:hypothetical protein